MISNTFQNTTGFYTSTLPAEARMNPGYLQAMMNQTSSIFPCHLPHYENFKTRKMDEIQNKREKRNDFVE
jgi:hypothetical protein